MDCWDYFKSRDECRFEQTSAPLLYPHPPAKSLEGCVAYSDNTVWFYLLKFCFKFKCLGYEVKAKLSKPVNLVIWWAIFYNVGDVHIFSLNPVIPQRFNQHLPRWADEGY